MVTPYQKERCIAYIREKRPEISYAKVCRVMGRSRTSKYYKNGCPKKMKNFEKPSPRYWEPAGWDARKSS
ncbi:hypothetical protein LDL59_05345 [Kaistella anthropi]|nr:hypothetical protein [Kaistella anthropi]